MVEIYKFVGVLPARMGGAMGEAQGHGEAIKAEIRKDTAPDIGAVSAGKSFIPFLIVTE